MSWLPSRLPEDVDAERSLLSTWCAPGAAQGCTTMILETDASIFVHPKHQAVFRALRALAAAGTEVSALTLKDQLDQADDLNRVGGFPGLVELLMGEDVERPQVLVEILTRKAKLRQLVHAAATAVREAASEADAPEVLSDRLASLLQGIVAQRGGVGLMPVDQVVDEYLAEMNDEIERGTGAGVRVGYPKWDRVTGGLKPGQLVVLAARPGIGKTALALNWSLRVGRRGEAVGIFSLEMDRRELLDRLVSDHVGISVRKVRTERDRSLFDRVAQGALDLAGMPIIINDQASTSAPEIVAQIKRQHHRRPLKMAVVDHLSLIESRGGDKESKANQVAEITRTLKVAAKDIGIPIVLLAQLNREVEKRQGGRPQLSDLRDSGSIEQDADIVAFLHRKMTPTLEGESQDTGAELFIAKHRGGPLAHFAMDFDGALTRYRELEFETQPYAQKPARML